MKIVHLGIAIDAVTTQNEPRHQSSGYPTLFMEPETQQELIRDYLGPKLREAGLNTEIIIWDHNWDETWFPERVLNDANVLQYIGGTQYI